MVRILVLVILSWFAFVLGQSKEGSGNIQKAEYLGSWAGDPMSFLSSLGWVIFSLGLDVRYCTYGDSNSQDFIKQAQDCVKQFEKHEIISKFCAKKGFTHYGIANLRISHSNIIVNAVTHNKYGHFMVVYGDLFCAMRTK